MNQGRGMQLTPEEDFKLLSPSNDECRRDVIRSVANSHFRFEKS